MAGRSSSPVRVFTVGDAAYFPAVVAMVNSLRCTGNTIPVTVGDAGFTDEQRALLESHVDVVDLDHGGSRNPALLKADAACRSDASVALFVDADVIVTSPLDALIRLAQIRGVAAAVDPLPDRWFAEWSEICGLRAPLRREPYVNTGFVVLDRAVVPGLVERWAEVCGGADEAARAAWGENHLRNPMFYWDQEPLNAVLMSEFPPGRVTAIENASMLPSELWRTRSVDVRDLRFRRNGRPVPFLHNISVPKPWLPSEARDLVWNAYTRALRRVLAADDVEIRVPPHLLAPWLRPGWRSAAWGAALYVYGPPARASRPLRHRVGLAPFRGRMGASTG